MNKRIFLFIVTGVLLSGPTSLPAVDKSTPVSVVKATSAPVYDEIPLTGSVESRRVSQLSPKLSGYVDDVLVEEGDYVEKGQDLLRLDRVMAEIELDRIRAEIREAEARLAEASRQRDEAAELVQKKHIPSTNYETRVSEVEIAAASLQRLQAGLARQKEVLARHTIQAPFDGVIGDKLVEAGQWVETGTALFELVEIDVLRIDIPVPQYYFGRIEPGLPVSVRFDALPDYTLRGSITMKIPVGNVSGRTFPVRIEFDNRNRRIAPGMSARVTVRLSEPGETESLLLPRDTIVKKPDGSSTVWVVNEENGTQVARPVTVQTGRSFQGNIEIIEGEIEAGDRVVIRGNEILEAGQSVRIHREVKLEI